MVNANNTTGDVNFYFTQNIYSVCFLYTVEGKDGAAPAPNGDVGLSDIIPYGIGGELLVTCLSITAKSVGQNTAAVNWSAASELNNKHFEID
jgi:hypothetical protein